MILQGPKYLALLGGLVVKYKKQSAQTFCAPRKLNYISHNAPRLGAGNAVCRPLQLFPVLLQLPQVLSAPGPGPARGGGGGGGAGSWRRGRLCRKCVRGGAGRVGCCGLSLRAKLAEQEGWAVSARGADAAGRGVA